MDNSLLCNQADTLLDRTIQLCGTKNKRPTRFPKDLYSSFINSIINNSLEIQKYAIFIQESHQKLNELKPYLYKMNSYCILLYHQIRLCYSKKWISIKQRDSWIKDVNKVQIEIEKILLK